MNLKTGLLAIAFILTACSETPVPEEQAFLDSAAAAIGGADRISGVSALKIEANGRMLNIGQDETPESMTRFFELSEVTRLFDLANERSRTTRTRTPLFPYFLGQDPVTQTFGLADGVAYTVSPVGGVREDPVSIRWERESLLYHHPVALLRAALLGNAAVSDVRDEGAHRLADFTLASGKRFTLGVDPTTGLPAFVRSTDHHYYLRDAVRETRFADYEPVGDLGLPTALTESLDEFTVIELEVSAQEINPALSGLSAPPGATPAADPEIEFDVEEVDDGVFLLSFRGYNTVVIEFADHLMLIEAPNEKHTLAAIAAARELVPEKPITQMVNSHYHFDHSAGVRAAIAEGLTILTHSANETFYRRMAAQPSTIVADALANNPRDIDIEVFDETITYEDDSMTVELYHLAGSPHMDALLMAYLPKQGLVIQGDAFTPGSRSPQTSAPNLLENIERYELEVSRIVPLHNGVVELAALKEAVAALQ